MKRLYILRHAKARPMEQGQRDFDRILAQAGEADAMALGSVMQGKAYEPDHVLCSSSRRTALTYEGLNLAQEAEYIGKFYDASAGDLLAAIQDTPDQHNSLMIVGHNPAIHELALRLSSEDNPISLLQRLLQRYSPGTLSVLDCPVQVWNDIQLGENMLLDLLEPMDYNAPERPTRWM